MKNKIDNLVGCLIDPPSGWQFGFPKLFVPRAGETMSDWLAREGYPVSDIDFALQYLRVIDVRD